MSQMLAPLSSLTSSLATSNPPKVATSPHPHLKILSDCCSVIFDYYIHEVDKAVDVFSKEDLAFFSRHIHCWKFDAKVNVKEFLERTRGSKLTLYYVESWNNVSIDSETMKYFRGIHELHIGHLDRMFPLPICDEDFANLRGIHTLSISYCNQITDSAFVNLRGIHTMRLYGSTQISDAGLENLRGVKEMELGGNNWTIKGLENLRGIEILSLSNCSDLTSEMFVNLRGLKHLTISNADFDTISDSHFQNLIGLEELHLHYVRFSSPWTFTGEGFEYLRGLKMFSSVLSLSGDEDSIISHLPHGLDEAILGGESLTSSGLVGLYGTKNVTLLSARLYIDELNLEHAKHCLKHVRRFHCAHLVEGRGADELVAFLRSRGCEVISH